METINLSDLTIDRRVQLTARKVNEDTMRDYARALDDGAQFPPVVAYRLPDGTLVLSGGFHRYQAHLYLGRQTIEAEILDGTSEEAAIHAALDNIAHGRPMTRKEKEEAGKRLFKLTTWSDREIARRLAVNNATVSRWRESCNKREKPKENVANATPGAEAEQTTDEDNGEAGQSEMWAAEEEATSVKPSGPCPYAILCGDFREAEIEPASIDVILTDPPYPYEFIHLYAALAERAAIWLKDDGVLLCMAGQSYLPEILSSMGAYLKYNWMLAYLTPGGQSPQIWDRQVNTFWKPVLCFVKGKYARNWLGDVVKSAVNDNDKRFHEWGQSESGMANLIERFTYPGDIVLDPMMGAGTTGVAAVRHLRRFIGIDLDPDTVAVATGRLEATWHNQE